MIKEEQNQTRLTGYVRGVSKKLKALNQEIELTNGDIVIFSIFDVIRIKPRMKEITFSVNEVFRYMINNLVGNFTKFDLRELVNLKSGYSKSLFRILKQWETTKEYYVKIEDFRELMGIPQTYQMKNIRQKIFKPCIEELENYFSFLELTEIKKGRSVESLKFTWKDKKRAKTEKAIKGAKELFNKAIADKKTLEVEKEVQELEKQEQKPLEQNTIIQREKITSKAYESKYKEYLKVLGVEHNTFVRKSFDIINKPLYEIIEDTENKIKIKPQEIKTKYQEFLNKYDCDDNPIMKKAFDEILEKEYIIDLS